MCLFTLLAGLCPNLSPADETSDLFSRYRGRVLQVQIIDTSSGSRASIGSGFQVSAAGLVVTNFHVIAELIYRPTQYSASYLADDGRQGELRLLAIDVVHDLALLESDSLGGEYLELALDAPNKGERLYALGNPHDLGWTIVEGTFNGYLEKSIYEKIHFTGSINPGMSGGPTLDKDGRVVGVNVSTAGNQLSFLVPVKHVLALLSRGAHPAAERPDFTREATHQLLSNQDRYIDSLLEAPLARVKMKDFHVPGRLAHFFSCWGDTQHREEALYEWAYQSCSTSDDLFLSERQRSGAVSFSHELFSTEELGPIRFFGFLQERFQTHRPRLEADEEMVTNYDCETAFVSHNRLQSKVVFCLRAYRKFEGLFDAFMKSSVLVSDDEALQSTLTVSGVSYENAIRLARGFMEAIEWSR